MRTIPVPLAVVQEVEQYVTSELLDAEKFDNRTPLDESGVFDLHTLVAKAYAAGFDDGERAAYEKARWRDTRREQRAERGATS